jgi:lysophospholipase L1-like esterase
MKTRLLKRLLFVVYLFVATSLLLEVGVRVWGYSERHICDPIYTTFAPSTDIPYVHKPNLHDARARGLAIINTDSLGLRSKVAGARYEHHQSGEYRIAIVGDSVTFGEGVRRTEDTYAQTLEDTLNQRQSAFRVKVFNYGASAYSVKVMEATLEERVLEVEPDLVLMAIIPPDFDLTRTPSVDGWGYLTDNKLSGFLPKDSRIRIYLRKVHLLYLLRDMIYSRQTGSRQVQEILLSGNVPESYSFIRRFSETARQHKLAYAVALLPMLDGKFAGVPARLQADDIPFVDLSTLRDEFTVEQFKASKFDSHPSAAVHRRLGELLADYILDRRLMDSPR